MLTPSRKALIDIISEFLGKLCQQIFRFRLRKGIKLVSESNELGVLTAERDLDFEDSKLHMAHKYFAFQREGTSEVQRFPNSGLVTS